MYSPVGEYVYRRKANPRKIEYSRVATTKIYSTYLHWYEIDEMLWEPVDVYGMPVNPYGSGL